MKKLILICLLANVFAGNLGLIFLHNWHASENGTVISQGDLKVTGSNNYFGAAVLLPLSLLMGSSLELGLSILPKQLWEKDANKISVTARKIYSLNTLYTLSDSLAMIAGATFAQQNLTCVNGCSQVKSEGVFGDRFGVHAGFQWLFPVFEHVASGVRMLYNFRVKHDYCYGTASCDSKFMLNDKRIAVQAIAAISL